MSTILSKSSLSTKAIGPRLGQNERAVGLQLKGILVMPVSIPVATIHQVRGTFDSQASTQVRPNLWLPNVQVFLPTLLDGPNNHGPNNQKHTMCKLLHSCLELSIQDTVCLLNCYCSVHYRIIMG